MYVYSDGKIKVCEVNFDLFQAPASPSIEKTSLRLENSTDGSLYTTVQMGSCVRSRVCATGLGSSSHARAPSVVIDERRRTGPRPPTAPAPALPHGPRVPSQSLLSRTRRDPSPTDVGPAIFSRKSSFAVVSAVVSMLVCVSM